MEFCCTETLASSLRRSSSATAGTGEARRACRASLSSPSRRWRSFTKLATSAARRSSFSSRELIVEVREVLESRMWWEDRRRDS